MNCNCDDEFLCGDCTRKAEEIIRWRKIRDELHMEEKAKKEEKMEEKRTGEAFQITLGVLILLGISAGIVYLTGIPVLPW